MYVSLPLGGVFLEGARASHLEQSWCSADVEGSVGESEEAGQGERGENERSVAEDGFQF